MGLPSATRTTTVRHRRANPDHIGDFADLYPSVLSLRYVKLLLDPTQDMPDFVSTSEMREQLAIAGKDATAIVADYLREVYTHASSELAKRYGKLFLKTTKLEWVLTVSRPLRGSPRQHQALCSALGCV